MTPSKLWIMEQPNWDTDVIRADIMSVCSVTSNEQPHQCPACDRKLGFYRDVPPFTLECDGSRKGLADFSPRSGQDAYVSTRLLKAMQRESITGWKYLAEAKIVKGRPKKYILQDPIRHYIEICYTEAVRIDEQASEVVRRHPIRCFYCTSGYAGFKRIVFQQPRPGAIPDLFRCFNLHASMFCSETFRCLFVHGGFSGVDFYIPSKFRDWKRDSFIGGEVNMKSITGDLNEYIRQEHIRFPTDADADTLAFGDDDDDR